MSEDRGTLEALADELTVLLSPLTSLTPANTVFLAQLSIVIDDTQAASIASALTKLATAIANLIDLDTQLNASITSAPQRRRLATHRGANQVADMIAAFSQLKTSVGGLGLPGSARSSPTFEAAVRFAAGPISGAGA